MDSLFSERFTPLMSCRRVTSWGAGFTWSYHFSYFRLSKHLEIYVLIARIHSHFATLHFLPLVRSYGERKGMIEIEWIIPTILPWSGDSQRKEKEGQKEHVGVGVSPLDGSGTDWLMKIGRFTGSEQENVRWKGYSCYFIARVGRSHKSWYTYKFWKPKLCLFKL